MNTPKEIDIEEVRKRLEAAMLSDASDTVLESLNDIGFLIEALETSQREMRDLKEKYRHEISAVHHLRTCSDCKAKDQCLAFKRLYFNKQIKVL